MTASPVRSECEAQAYRTCLNVSFEGIAELLLDVKSWYLRWFAFDIVRVPTC